QEDGDKLAKEGVGVVLGREEKEVYGNVEEGLKAERGKVEKELWGKLGRGDFGGVGSVVRKLLNMVEGDSGCLGKKE
ncbi:pantoate--beta-alanine ligase, partial [Neisseria sicca]|uniref:pantoate--beta-alanine ligase n=1 Tax=Neisseria sicca TaxID=490 RepID=UPI00164996AB